MKKILLFLLIILIFSLVSCGGNGGGNVGGEAFAVQDILDAPHESCVVTVITALSNGEWLNSKCDMRVMSNGTTQIKVILQELSDFKSQNGTYKPNNQNYITTTEAFYIVEDGEVIKNVGGKALKWTPTGDFPTFNASPDYLDNISDSGTNFTATITDIKGFAGWDVVCTDATVTIYYGEDSVQSVVICYTDSVGNKTEVRYSFDA